MIYEALPAAGQQGGPKVMLIGDTIRGDRRREFARLLPSPLGETLVVIGWVEEVDVRLVL